MNVNRIIINTTLTVLCCFCFLNNALAGSVVDTTFNASAFGTANGQVYDVVEQPDGKILFGGEFTEVHGIARTSIVRLNADGSLDTTFNPPVLFGGTFSGGPELINAIAVQKDGKILIGGNLRGYGNITRTGIYRLNADGSFDSSYAAFSLDEVNDIEILPDGKILSAGSNGVNKFDTNGTLNDQASGFGISYDLEILSNGKIYVSGSRTNGLIRFNADLTIDTTFAPVNAAFNQNEGIITTIEVQTNGKILVGGRFNTLNGFSQRNLSRVNTDGSLDLAFNLNGSGTAFVYEIKIRSNGKIIIGGAGTYNGQNLGRIIQLNDDGSVDGSFQNSFLPQQWVYSFTITSNGSIIAGLSFLTATLPEPGINSIVKFDSVGNFNSSFDAKVTKAGSVNAIKQDTDGKIYIAGDFLFVNGFRTHSVARLNSDGSVDTSFVSSLITPGDVSALEIQPDGKILVSVSRSLTSGIRRLNTDGSLDASFANSTVYNDLILQPDGKILYTGFNNNISDYVLGRLNSDLTPDGSFTQVRSDDAINSIALQSDGKVLAVGFFTQIDSVIRGRIARINSDGSLDTSFNPPGGANGGVFDVDVQADGKILIGGIFTALNGNSGQQRIGRLNSNGTLDTSFAQNSNATVRLVKARPDGKIFIGGDFSALSSASRIGFAKLNADGSVDNSFIVDVPRGVLAIDIQSDNKILIGGAFVTVNGQNNVRVARLLNDTVVPNASVKFDYDGDGRADISVFRPSSNVWYQLTGVNYNFSQTNFGTTGDIVTPGDFDGDGRSDLAIFRPSTGDWWYRSSVTNSNVQATFGQSGDIPRPSDIDGDGKDDLVVYRPSNNVWYSYGSLGATSIIQFGTAGDKPVVGDFDGDGKGDIAIYRPSTGTWWYQSSLDGLNKAIQFGISSDIPNPADFDGDGKTDLAVYRPSNGVWYVYNSSNGSATIIQFGLAGDKPIAADYDGDGKADFAVYRPSTGVWYLLRSTEGFAALQFGIDTDVPIPNALVP